MSLRVLFCLFVSVVLAGTTLGQLNDGPPVPYVRVSEDGGRVLVMLSGVAGQVDRVGAVSLADGRTIEVLTDYKVSGVYSVADGGLVYPTGWYCWDAELVSSGDLRYLMRSNRHGLFDTWGLKFYDEGVETRSYGSGEMITGFRNSDYLPLSTDWWYYPWHGPFSVADGVVSFDTPVREYWGRDLGYRESLRFDLVSGELLSLEVHRGAGFLKVVAIVGVGIVLVVGGLVWWLVRLLRRQKPHGVDGKDSILM